MNGIFGIFLRRIGNAAGSVFNIHCAGTLVFHSRQQSGIARAAILRPSLDAQWENSNPLLGNDAFQVALPDGIRIACFPSDRDRTGRSLHTVVTHRISVFLRCADSIRQIGIGAGRTPLLERKPDGCFVEVFGVALHRPVAQSAFGAQERHLRGIHP